MATIKSCSAVNLERTAFYLVRRSQASIAGYLNFGQQDLAKYLERDSFRTLATRLTDHFFRKSRDLALSDQVKELYLALLIMAPILQRLPLSAKFDWHSGHLVSFFRSRVNGNQRRYHFSSRTVARTYQPDKLLENLELLGVGDSSMVEVLADLYRRHAGGTVLKDLLAHQLFDPIIMSSEKRGYELRYGNILYRLEREPFSGSIDLRRTQQNLLNYLISSVEHSGGRHLEIMISDASLTGFREQIKRVISLSTSPEYKLATIERHVRDFVERTRSARSALPQITELKIWLAHKLRHLAATRAAANLLPNLLVNLWLQRADANLYLKKPTFFLDPSAIDEKTYLTFFSPYREVSS
jgi:hypothetical protein